MWRIQIREAEKDSSHTVLTNFMANIPWDISHLRAFFVTGVLLTDLELYFLDV